MSGSLPPQIEQHVLGSSLALANTPEGAERVLAGARRVLERDGPTALSMRNVAAEAGVTATAIYRHYASKDALLQVLIRECYDVFLEYVTPIAPATVMRSPLQQLVTTFDRYLDFALEHPASYELLFASAHRISIDLYPVDFNTGKSRGFRQLRSLVAECIEAGEIRDGDPADVALDLYGHAHGLVMLHRAGRFGDREEGLRRFYRRSLARLF
ncbi:MAG TPA: TetR/AcrR family transcriptional regulator [Gemmatimonadaceae bacterium]